MNENEILEEAPVETVEAKKTTTVKKSGGKKTTTARVEAPKQKEIATMTETSTKEKTKKQYDLHDMVPVRNMTPGSLIYKSNRNLGYLVEWAGYNDEQPMEVLELKNMLASQRAFFERNWIWIDDPVLVEELGVSKYYKNMLSPEQVDALFEEDPDTMIQNLEKLHSDMRNTMRVVAKEKIAAGEITSYTVIQVLQKYFGVPMVDEE